MTWGTNGGHYEGRTWIWELGSRENRNCVNLHGQSTIDEVKEMLEQFSLQDKVAVITGASRGIGKAVALGFSEAGAKLVLAARSEDALAPASSQIQCRNGECLSVACDVAIEEDVKKLAEAAKNKYGRVDILVNSAGISPYDKPAIDLTDDEWNNVISVNLTGTFHCCREIGRIMLGNRSGSIINLASMGSYVGFNHGHAYVASKGGVQLLTKALAVEWASEGIRVNAIAPGFIRTDMEQFFLDRNPESEQMIIERTPLGRLAPPEDLVGAFIYLASDASRFVTGETIVVDGGYLAV